MGVVRGKLNKMAGRGTFGVALAGIGLGLFGVYKTCFYTGRFGCEYKRFSNFEGSIWHVRGACCNSGALAGPHHMVLCCCSC